MLPELKDAYIISVGKGNDTRLRIVAAFHWGKEMSQDFKDAYSISLKKGNVSSVQGCLQHFIEERKCLK